MGSQMIKVVNNAVVFPSFPFNGYNIQVFSCHMDHMDDLRQHNTNVQFRATGFTQYIRIRRINDNN